MADRYWISDGVSQAGPYPPEDLPAQGLRADSLVWAEGMPDWQRADEVEALGFLLGREAVESPAWPPEPLAEAAPPQAEAPAWPAQTENPGWHSPPAPQPLPTAALAYQTPASYAPPSQAMAITSFVLGLAGFFVGFVASILAIVFGHIALGRIRRGEEGGWGFAIAGLVLGYLMVVATALFMALFGVAFCGAACLG